MAPPSAGPVSSMPRGQRSQGQRASAAAAYTAIARQTEDMEEENEARGGDELSPVPETPQRRAGARARMRKQAAAASVVIGTDKAAVEATALATAPAPPASTRRRTLSSKAQAKARQEDTSDPDSSELSAPSEEEKKASPPKKKRRRAAAKQEEEEGGGGGGGGEAESLSTTATAAKATRRGRKTKKAAAEEKGEADFEEDGEKTPKSAERKKRTPRKPKNTEPVVYDIPPVPTRDFASEGLDPSHPRGPFRGRLGYACLNTILRAQKPSVFSSRTTRIKSIEERGLDFVRELSLANVRDIIPMVEWNEAHGIKFMRLSSEMFPFATHPLYGYDFVGFAREELRKAGEVARKLGHRLTMHPGQFCQLGTPKADVLEASIRELEMHAQILDGLGMDQDSVMILHGGGVYGDREGTIERIKNTIQTRLSPSARARLVLENDELAYSVEELLPISKELKVPIVLDFHHDMLRPSSRPPSELIPEILEIWKERGIKPKFHLSEPRPGAKSMRERRAHSDRCTYLPSELPADADLMIEAKDKEQAVFELYRIYNLVDVQPFWADLRPPAADQSTSTSGRKSGAASSSQSEQAKALRTLIKAKKIERKMERKRALAEGRTPPPEGDSDLDDWTPAKDRPPVASQVEVLEAMRTEADWIRAELRAGRDRRAYGADEEDGDEGDGEGTVESDAEDGGGSSVSASPLKGKGKASRAKANGTASSKLGTTTKLHVDGQAAGAQEDLVAVVTDHGSAGAAGSSSSSSLSTTEAEATAPVLVVKPGVEADPSAESTPLDSVAAAAPAAAASVSTAAAGGRKRKKN
ncbi:hypothetical protein OC842_004911 [Tilletia horrida]|uniref:UV-damage endonuclease n=1 Tax=Tilletia horrida TaxID=155126 RepID=A0AAN6GB55_9BASI|nr:hypothetical protein OC842_004911 [Tilletia horrida]